MSAKYPKHDITALILAGGRGRRMGGADKGLVPYRGLPLVAHVARSLGGQAAHLLVSANRSEEAYRGLGFTPLPDRRAQPVGPLGGIEAALPHCETPYLLVSPCDTPHIPADLGTRLWAAMSDADAQGAYATASDGDHYLHLLVSVAACGDLSAFLDSGRRAVRHWLADKGFARVRFRVDELANVNSLADAEGRTAPQGTQD